MEAVGAGLGAALRPPPPSLRPLRSIGVDHSCVKRYDQSRGAQQSSALRRGAAAPREGGGGSGGGAQPQATTTSAGPFLYSPPAAAHVAATPVLAAPEQIVPPIAEQEAAVAAVAARLSRAATYGDKVRWEDLYVLVVGVQWAVEKTPNRAAFATPLALSPLRLTAPPPVLLLLLLLLLLQLAVLWELPAVSTFFLHTRWAGPGVGEGVGGGDSVCMWRGEGEGSLCLASPPPPGLVCQWHSVVCAIRC